MSPKILILLHETDPFPDGWSYMLAGLREVWLEMGLDVRLARGLGAIEPADLVIPHLDVTVTPPDWREVLGRLPNVINRGVYDISKHLVSENLVGPTSDWDGSVIVKTDRNTGGLPELAIERRRMNVVCRFASKLSTGLERRVPFWPRMRHVYQVFPSLREVPEWVFSSPDLVVERFLPEREGDVFYLRMYIFVGNRYRSSRIGSRDPIAKMKTEVSRVCSMPVPAEVVDYRMRWGLDYGKIDYVMHEGRPVILDVARTPSSPNPPLRTVRCRLYAPGVYSLLDRARGGAWPSDHRDVDAV